MASPTSWLPLSAYLVIFLACLRPSLSDDEHTARVRRQVTWKQRNIRVATILNAPYTMVASADGGFNGYEGFIPDLLRFLERRLNLNIDLYLVEDNRYGALLEDNVTWTGLIGDVIKREKGETGGADIAAAPLTITSAREKVVNFIMPFQHLGLTMVIRKPELKVKDIWSYSFDIVKPLAPEVWAFCTVGIFVVGALLWANNRFNPYEWGGRHNLGRAGESASEAFNLPGSMWFAFTTFQWQGFERAPRSISSKVLTCFWFSFVTITLVTYTGSLVNHLFWASTVHGRATNPQPAIQDLADLVRQDDYDYGYIQGGSTDRYFSDVARGPIFDRMRYYWSTARGQKSLMKSSSDGIKAVRSRKYVFIMEKYTAEYLRNRKPCDIQTVGPLIGMRSFGLAVPHNMPHNLSEALHSAILEMTEEGDIEALEEKWWKDMGECWNVADQERTLSQKSSLFVNKPKVINLEMFWGPLVLLLVGIVATILVAIAEILYYKYKGRYQRQNRPGDARLQLDDDGTA